MNNLDKDFENYFKLSKLSKLCFLIFLGFLVLGSNYNTAKTDKEQNKRQAILDEWQEIHNNTNNNKTITKKQNNTTLKTQKKALMVGNNKKLVSRVLNANGTVNWRHDNTYDRIYDNKGSELSQRKFFQ
ncbi:hypothetical protein [Rice orange leaf phytoplasma]|uniref:hypothetical protein n=1 Tax=Rice orange leaf phytoplasma TaxID=146897 RepID=UPI0008F5DED0|nr:hypothetical protein [Rice orange leaf phytoplasma]OIJ44766.1 hypothetical protein BHE82_01150 [Rice orange leaf phytoplasma]